jgi:hypothetical protein
MSQLGRHPLICHPHAPSRAVQAVAVQATRTAEGKLSLHYSLQGTIGAVSIPAPGPARLGWKLWRHTCCELFVSEAGAATYHELNFSPSGEWAAYAFSKYREGITLTDEGTNPQIAVQSSDARFDLYALADLPRLAPAYRRARLAIGLAVIVEEQTGGLSYWALRHAPGKPDFHHPAAFALQLDEVAG